MRLKSQPITKKIIKITYGDLNSCVLDATYSQSINNDGYQSNLCKTFTSKAKN